MSIEGRAFAEGCQDTMSCSGGLGCQSCKHDDPPPVPMQDVGLRLVQRDRTWHLGAADAGTADDNHLGWVTWRFQVPSDARPGPATLVAENVEPLRVRVR